MVNIWAIAAGTLAVAAAVVVLRAKQRHTSNGPALRTVSEQWLAEQRGRSHEEP
jgi:hypothetical protein